MAFRSEGQDRIAIIKATASLVDQVLDRANVEQAKSKDFWICPYHRERTGSFHVFDSGRKFKCFGCSVTGDAIDLVGHIWKVKPGSAIHMLWKGLAHPGWTRERLKMIAKRDSKTPKQFEEELCRMLSGIAGGNASALRKEGKRDWADIKEALAWADYYEDRALDGDGWAPPAAYRGLIKICQYLSRVSFWKLPRGSKSGQAWKRDHGSLF